MSVREIAIQSVFWFVVLLINGRIAIRVYHWNNKRNDRKFLRHLHIWFPDAEIIDLVSIESTDEAAINKIKEQVRERQRAREER